MKTFTIYDPISGEIVGHITGGDFELKHNVDPAHRVVDGKVDPATHLIIDGKPVARETPIVVEPTWSQKRVAAYPPLGDLADAIVAERSGDPSKMAAYIAACLDVKANHPKD